MRHKNKIKVLVVEDDANWREALCQMYKEIIPQCHVKSADSGPSALRAITNGENFDLLSLDINLGSTHPKTAAGQPDLKVQGADGRSVLRKFHEKNACNGVVVITGLNYDETITFVIPNENEFRRVRSSLQVFLNTLFPSRHLYINKIKDIQTAEDNIKIIRKDLTFDKITSICQPLHGVPPPYTIELTIKNSILIRSQKRRDSSIVITHPKDKALIELMCMMKKYPEQNWIEKKTVCAIYRGEKAKNSNNADTAQYAESDINSFKRRLKNKGIDIEVLFEVVRGLGWKLRDDVHLIGFASVDKRTSGLSNMAIDDLSDNGSPDTDSFDESSDQDY